MLTGPYSDEVWRSWQTFATKFFKMERKMKGKFLMLLTFFVVFSALMSPLNASAQVQMPPPPGSEQFFRDAIKAIQEKGGTFRGFRASSDADGYGTSYCRAEILYDASSEAVHRDIQGLTNQYAIFPEVVHGGLTVFFGEALNFVWQSTDQFPCPPPFLPTLAAAYGLNLTDSGHYLNGLSGGAVVSAHSNSISGLFSPAWFILPIGIILLAFLIFGRPFSSVPSLKG